ncbi:MAG: TetR family transcriptional regulator [Pseudomonadales bacterium]
MNPLVEQSQPQAAARSAMDALDAQAQPYLYAHPDALRILAVNAAAANDLASSKNQLTQTHLGEVLHSKTLLDCVRRARESGEAQHVSLTSQCCPHWQHAEIAAVGQGATHFIKVSVNRRQDAAPVKTTPSAHDCVATELVEQALELLREEGCRKFSVRKVARNAGVGLGHLQHYYRPKVRLLQAMADVITFELVHHYEQHVAPLPDSGARLLGVIDFVLNQHQQGGWLVLIREFRTMGRDDPSLRPLLSSLYQECQRLFHQLFVSINPTLSREQIGAIAKEVLTLLSSADEFTAVDGEHSNYRAHLTARILGLVHSDVRSPANSPGAALVADLTTRQLLDLARALVSLPDPQRQLASLNSAALALLGCDQINVYLGRGRRFRGHSCLGESADVQQIFHQFVVPADDPSVQAAIDSQRCQLIAKPTGARAANATLETGQPAARAIVALFDQDGSPCGLFSAGYNTPLPNLSSSQSALLEGLAAICESIVHNEPALIR